MNSILFTVTAWQQDPVILDVIGLFCHFALYTSFLSVVSLQHGGDGDAAAAGIHMCDPGGSERRSCTSVSPTSVITMPEALI